MNAMLEMTDLIAPEGTTLQEKECVPIDDSSLPAARVLTEQIKHADGEDNGAPLFIP